MTERRMPRRAILAVLFIVVAVTAVVLWQQRTEPEDRSLFASGTVESTEAELSFRIPGRIAALEVEEGDRVSAGDLLGSLAARELEANRSAAQAQLLVAGALLRDLESGSRAEEIRSAEAAVRVARDRWEEARREAERAERLHSGGAISRDALDRARTAEGVAEGQRDQATEALELVRQGPRSNVVAAQRARVLQAEASVEHAWAALENARIEAPFDGVVTTRHREVGETVGAGVPVVSLRDPSDRWVRIYIREDQIGRVRIGGAAEIASDSDPNRIFEGRVVHIGSEAEFTPRNVQTAEERLKLVYPVKVAIVGDPDDVLKPGVPADVTLVGTEGGS